MISSRFISVIISGSVDTSSLISSINFIVSARRTRNVALFVFNFRLLISSYTQLLFALCVIPMRIHSLYFNTIISATFKSFCFFFFYSIIINLIFRCSIILRYINIIYYILMYCYVNLGFLPIIY